MITTCPTCGSRKIRRVKRDVTSRHKGRTFTATGVEVEECPVCGERLFGPKAMEHIARQRPGQSSASARRKRSA